MKILVVGSGAREHAMIWKMSQSPLVEKIYCAPGNPGIAERATCVAIDANDINALLLFARNNGIDLTVPGPEGPLVRGIVDEFEAQGLPVFGPSQRAAELEGSKAFAKLLMRRNDIPTAEWVVFHKPGEAREFLNDCDYPCVIKADGLAAGKGSMIVHDLAEAEHALNRIMVQREFGDSGNKIVIEEFLQGEEASVFAISDGEHFVILSPAQDHKAIFDDDEGPNTGGMGAYAPAPLITDDLMAQIVRQIVEPTIRGMAMENRPYRGVLYVGLIITEEGAKVIEYNCRFGDPEAQVILPLLRSDLVELLQKTATRQLADYSVELSSKWAVCVVLSSGGYPGKYETGKKIIGLEHIGDSQVRIFHAGTSRSETGDLLTAGGRVLSVTAVGDNFASAREAAYGAVGKIAFDGAYYRKDIGAKALKYLSTSQSEQD